MKKHMVKLESCSAVRRMVYDKKTGEMREVLVHDAPPKETPEVLVKRDLHFISHQFAPGTPGADYYVKGGEYDGLPVFTSRGEGKGGGTFRGRRCFGGVVQEVEEAIEMKA